MLDMLKPVKLLKHMDVTYPFVIRDGYELCDQEIGDDASEYLLNMFSTTEKSYTFVHYGNIDGLGHYYQWCLDE